MPSGGADSSLQSEAVGHYLEGGVMPMYKIYASKSNDPDYNALVLYQSPERDESAKQCIALFRNGYTIHKVVLPSGREIIGDKIESALKRGLYSLRVAIGE